MILKLSFLTYQKSTGGPWILTCWGNQTSKPFSVFRRTALLKFQCVSGGKPFKITRSDLFVNVLNHFLLEKIANRRCINARILDYCDKFPYSSLYWEPTLARDSAYVTVQFAAIRELKLSFKKWYKMYYFLSLARFFRVEDLKECITEVTGFWNLYICICWFCMFHWLFFPSRVIFSTWKFEKHNNVKVFEIRENNKKTLLQILSTVC